MLQLMVCLVSMLVLAWPVQAHAWEPIEDHYFGATLFVASTNNVVSPSVAVSSLSEYVNTYGQIAGPEVDHGYQAARLFFANGGQTLYVIDPLGTQAEDFADALSASVDLPVDLVAIPGAACCSGSVVHHAAIMSALGQHVDATPNRFGLLDAPSDSGANEILVYRTAFTSEHTALYAPWLVLDGIEPDNGITVPSSPAVAGVISRIDREAGIYSTPAGPNAVLNVPPIVDVERSFSTSEQETLNSSNVNLLGNFVSPLAVHVWGGRTTRDENDRRYVSVARLLRHLEFSINRSLEPGLNGSPTAGDVITVEAFLATYVHGYWMQGALQGATADDAFFVNCSIVLSSLDCTVGVAVQKPAEFAVINLTIAVAEVVFESGFE